MGKQFTLATSTALLTLLMALSSSANASLWDDVSSWFSGDEEENATPESVDTPEPSPTPEPEAAKSAASSMMDTAVKQGMGLLPTLVQNLGVTEKQAMGGLGAMFTATKAVLKPEDFQVIADAVPGMDKFIAAAPPVNEMIGGAMSMLGGGAGSTAVAGLVSQFSELGLSTDMLSKFGSETANYLKTSSPEASAKLTGAFEEYLGN